MTSSLDQYPQRDGLYRVLPDGVAVHNRYQNRIILLDGISGELWLRADGKTTVREIACDIAGWSNLPVANLLVTIPMLLTILNSEGVMFQLDHPVALPYHLTRPQEDQDVEQMRLSLSEAGWI
jgi:hypothetical protein